MKLLFNVGDRLLEPHKPTPYISDVLVDAFLVGLVGVPVDEPAMVIGDESWAEGVPLFTDQLVRAVSWAIKNT